ncbi:MAG: SDR family NAD(P)-dependent oxidoreductase [Desulfosarcinaceae bacterium]|nr:SDR family NAD(P)-dependent oxidoreductase [Desulfosarcinaceae bacterium]
MKEKGWNTTSITDQSGRVAIVTGSTSGIGLETARVLASKGAAVIVAARDGRKGQQAAADIHAAFPEAQVMFRELDLADLSSVRRFAAGVSADYDRLDLLINNAGVMVPPYGKTKDGFERQIGTNHMGHFALTGLLVAHLKATRGSRVVTVSSMAHKAGRIDLDDLDWERRRYKKWQAYGDSKIANLYFTYALQKRLAMEVADTIAVAAHPGWTATELQRHTLSASLLNPLFAQTIAMGALPTLRAALDPDAEGGDYYGPSGFAEMRGYPVKVASNRRSRDLEIAERLWEVSEARTGVTYPKPQSRAA